MNNLIQSWTPTVYPLGYDAIIRVNGCESLAPVPVFTSLGYDRICISLNAGESAFESHETSSSCLGAMTELSGSGGANVLPEFPFLSVWSLYADSGIFLSMSEPSYRAEAIWGGSISPIRTRYTTPFLVSPEAGSAPFEDRVSIGVNAGGVIYLASSDGTQSRLSTIPVELADLSNNYTSHHIKTVTGFSPVVLSYFPLIGYSSISGVAMLYLKATAKDCIFALYEDSFYNDEIKILSGLRTKLSKLISATVEAGKIIIRAIDVLGRNVTISSPSYPLAFTDKQAVSTTLDGGAVFALLTEVEVFAEKSSISMAIDGGFVFDATAETTPVDPEAATISIALIGGEITQIL